jgi:hypothetical protein
MTVALIDRPPTHGADRTVAELAAADRTPVDAVQRSAEPRRRDSRGRGRVRSAFGASLAKWLVIMGSVAMLVFVGIPRLIDGFGAMFEETEVDRTGPTLLQAVTDLSDYEAAAANLQVIVDLERDSKYLPAALRGERTIFQATGVARAGVSFSNLTADKVVTDPVTGQVTITLPKARITDVSIDLSKSKVIEHRRGVLDRLGSTFGDTKVMDRRLTEIAEARLRDAAVESAVLSQAEANTRSMLTSLVTALGHPSVTVTFAEQYGQVPTAREM